MPGNRLAKQKQQLDEAISETCIDDDGKFDFPSFCAVAAKFMIEEDEEQMREELKEAFRHVHGGQSTLPTPSVTCFILHRIYDKEGNGYITTVVLKEILHEIDPELTNEDLDGIIEEVDEDGSGTLDFDGVYHARRCVPF